MVPKLFRFLPCALAALVLGCNSHPAQQGSAEGYGGGDNDIALVESARLAAVAAIKKIRDGEIADAVCEIPICLGPMCSALRSLTAEQKQFLARALTDRPYTDGLLAVLENPASIRVSNERLVVSGKEVDAVSELGGGKIILSRERVPSRILADLIALLVHESMHAAAFPYDTTDGLLSDEEAVADAGNTLFTSGRQLADLTGGCVQLHDEREKILDSIKSIGETPPRSSIGSGGGTTPTPTAAPNAEATPTPSAPPLADLPLPSLPPELSGLPLPSSAPRPPPSLILPLPSLPPPPPR